MSKATEDQLAALHGVVAKVLVSQLEHKAPVTEINAEGEFVPTDEMIFDASPATIGQAVKFLKDNEITCDVQVEGNMNNLRDALSRKQRRSELPDAQSAAKDVQH